MNQVVCAGVCTQLLFNCALGTSVTQLMEPYESVVITNDSDSLCQTCIKYEWDMGSELAAVHNFCLIAVTYAMKQKLSIEALRACQIHLYLNEFWYRLSESLVFTTLSY